MPLCSIGIVIALADWHHAPLHEAEHSVTPLFEVRRQLPGTAGGMRIFEIDPASVADFSQLRAGEMREIDLPGIGRRGVRIQRSERQAERPEWWAVEGEIERFGKITLMQNTVNNLRDAQLSPVDGSTSWALREHRSGDVSIIEMADPSASQCMASNAPPGEGESEGAPEPPPSIANLDETLQSRIGSPNVFYLDFRGGTITNAGINNGAPWVYGAIDKDNAFVRKLFDRIVEFYRFFDVNITTSAAVHDAAPVTRRTRIRITPVQWSGAIAGGIGGVAGTGDFLANKTDDQKPAWAFFNPPSYVPEERQLTRLSWAIAHELGHTIGLRHWSTTAYDVRGEANGTGEYYPVNDPGVAAQLHGIGDDAWAPLMGNFNPARVVQWSKGEYATAVNRDHADVVNPVTGKTERVITNRAGLQNDIVVLQAVLGYIPNVDVKGGNTMGTATALVMNNSVPNDFGMIHSETDEDWFSITKSASESFSIRVEPPAGTALDVYAEIRDSGGNVLSSSSPSNVRHAEMVLTNPAAGTYYLRIKGNAQGSPATNGWSSYGSIGSYVITGKRGTGLNFDTSIASLNAGQPPHGSQAIAYNFDLNASNMGVGNAPLSLIATSDTTLPPGLSLDLNSSGLARVIGTPTTAGVFRSVIFSSNVNGGMTKEFFFTIHASGIPLAQALDTPNMQWTTYAFPVSNPAHLWNSQTVYTTDGMSSARSGNQGANGNSWLQTFVTGPGLLKFKWATDCELNEDYLDFHIDNNTTPALRKTGRLSAEGAEGQWTNVQIVIGNGGHFLKWNYLTDDGGTRGEDAGFVDQVQFIPVPAFTAYRHLVTTVGHQAVLPLIPWNVDTTFAVNSGVLPAGLDLIEESGVILGVAATPGSTLVGFSATNEGGTNTTSKTIHVFPNISLSDALDEGSIDWNSGGDNAWAGVTSPASDGVDAARSGPLDANGTSWLFGDVNGEGTLTFYWKTTSDVGDLVSFSIDGVVQHQLSGSQDWQQRSYTINGAGTHRFRWDFVTDGSGGTGTDVAFVDRVTWTSGFPPVITSAGSFTAEQGQVSSYPIIATNSPTLYTLMDGTVPGMTLNQSSGIFSGTPSVAGQYNLVFRASNSAGEDLHGLTVIVVPSIPEAVDNFAQTFTRSGTGNWFGQQGQSQVGGDAAQSPDISDGQTSTLQTTVTGPINLSFWWKTSCEEINDYLICRDNGAEIIGPGQGRISGSNNFTQVSVSLGSGSHTITWSYEKNASGSGSADTGWVDGIQFGPALPVITSPGSISGPVGYPLNYDIIATNSPTSYNQTGTLPPGMFFSPTIHLITGFPSQAGVWTVSVSATNGAGTTSQNVTLHVQGSRVGWNLAHNLTGANALAAADPDDDGLPNLMEMALARNPNVRDNGFQPVDVEPVSKRLRARFRFNRRLADVTYHVETSPDCVTWTPIFTGSNFSWMTTPGTTFNDTFVTDMTYDLEVIDAAVAPGTPRKFMRMRLVETPPQQ